MTIRLATAADAELLVRLRLDYLAEGRALDADERQRVGVRLRRYFDAWLGTEGFFAVLAEEDGAALSTAFMSVAERPPRTAAECCAVGTVYNVYTYPAHRRRGLAARVMRTLLDETRARGIASVDLLASPEGLALYERLGFAPHRYTSMQLKLQARTQPADERAESSSTRG